MKRLFAGVVLVAVAAILTAPPAQAAAKRVDPVKALKAQLIAGHGVSFTEEGNTWVWGYNKGKSKGVVQFDRKGVTAYDVTTAVNMEQPLRTLSVGGNRYQSGGQLERLPEGTDWWKSKGIGSPFASPVQILQPKTLEAVLKTNIPEKKRAAHVKNTGNYFGIVTFDALAKATHTKVDKKLSGLELFWMLEVNAKGLPASFSTMWDDDEGRHFTTVEFRRWGAKVKLQAPAPDKVAPLPADTL